MPAVHSIPCFAVLGDRQFEDLLELDALDNGDDEDDFEELDEEWEDNDWLFRKERWEHKRVDWGYQVAKLLHEGAFHTTFRMQYRTFQKLVAILQESLQRQSSKSRGPKPVAVERIIGM